MRPGSKAPTPTWPPLWFHLPEPGGGDGSISGGLLDADLIDQAGDFFGGGVVAGSLVFFFQALFQVFRGDEAGFAIGQVTPSLFAESDEGNVRKADDAADAVHLEFPVAGVTRA